jgi:putative transposase
VLFRLSLEGRSGGQCVAIRYTGRLAVAGVEPSVGSEGESYDNALAETINGLYQAKLILPSVLEKPRGRRDGDPEVGTLAQPQRLLRLIACIPPAVAEANFHWQQAGQAMAA